MRGVGGLGSGSGSQREAAGFGRRLASDWGCSGHSRQAGRQEGREGGTGGSRRGSKREREHKHKHKRKRKTGRAVWAKRAAVGGDGETLSARCGGEGGEERRGRTRRMMILEIGCQVC